MIELKDKSRKEIQELLQRGGMLTHIPSGERFLVLLTKKDLANLNGDYWMTVWSACPSLEPGTKRTLKPRTVRTNSGTIYNRRKNYEYTT
tara:strand:- start:314 stop:583 length:270 start_codon:yes stop_codon:yes gene_type:complete